MKVLLIDINDERADKIDFISTWAGIELIKYDVSNSDLYATVRELHPEIILVDTNSNNRDTLEHLAQLQADAPRTVIKVPNTKSDNLNRLASDAGISLYAIDSVPAALLQVLIDVSITYFYSIDILRSEVASLKPQSDARHVFNQARRFIMDTYGLAEDQATDLLHKNADRQRRPLREVAEQLITTGSFS
jgi:response regulator NasT